jgi:hypothetical protein
MEQHRVDQRQNMEDLMKGQADMKSVVATGNWQLSIEINLDCEPSKNYWTAREIRRQSNNYTCPTTHSSKSREGLFVDVLAHGHRHRVDNSL